jgi:hypothetical protein
MAQFQLPIAVVLIVSTALSLVVFILTRRAEGKIRLPTYANDDDDEVLKHDPFDVTKAEDVADGYPIDEQGFWSRVR